MTLYLSNRDGDGKTSEEGHYRLQTRVYEGGILHPNDLKVTQNSPLSMSVLVDVGDFRIETSSGYSYTGWNNISTSVIVSTSDPASPRITTIVLYIDKSATTSPSPPNNPGIPKLIAIDGSPSVTPSAPSGATIQSAVGAGNPYMILANIAIAAAATQIIDANITDLRVRMKLTSDLLNGVDILAAVGPLIYPVGSIYCNYSNSSNPNTILGFGTWTALAGRFVVGIDGTQTEFDTINETGGAKTNTHFHWQTVGSDGTLYAEIAGSSSGQSRVITANRATYAPTGQAIAGIREDGTHTSTIATLPPYIVVYMWRRTA